jgi:hypothetical protein
VPVGRGSSLEQSGSNMPTVEPVCRAGRSEGTFAGRWPRPSGGSTQDGPCVGTWRGKSTPAVAGGPCPAAEPTPATTRNRERESKSSWHGNSPRRSSTEPCGKA